MNWPDEACHTFFFLSILRPLSKKRNVEAMVLSHFWKPTTGRFSKSLKQGLLCFLSIRSQTVFENLSYPIGAWDPGPWFSCGTFQRQIESRIPFQNNEHDTLSKQFFEHGPTTGFQKCQRCLFKLSLFSNGCKPTFLLNLRSVRVGPTQFVYWQPDIGKERVLPSSNAAKGLWCKFARWG